MEDAPPLPQERRHAPSNAVVLATGEAPVFAPGDAVRILTRFPVGHYRVPIYLRGRTGTVEAVIRAAGINNEEEGFGRNAGQKRHYYRVAVAMSELWPSYARGSRDTLHVEIFETWLEAITP